MQNHLQIYDVELTPSEFRLYKELMYRHAGISLAENKHSLVQNRLRKRLNSVCLSSFREYYEYICEKRHAAEFQECINALTTNETYFFRHKQHWDYIVSKLVPSWQQTSSKGSMFRVWSAASSTGEEPYSLAILLSDCLASTAGWRISVEATDINEEVLKQAKAGVYGEYSLQKVTSLCLKKYFTPVDDKHYRVADSIRKVVDFSVHNLQTPSSGHKYDMVFLRNVMIYFDDASKLRVISNISARIKNRGYLFLGGSEILPACQNQYEQIFPTVYRKIER